MKTTGIYTVWFILISITNDMMSENTLMFVVCLCLWIVDVGRWMSSISLFVLELEETGWHVERLSCVLLSFGVLVVAGNFQTSNVRVLSFRGWRLIFEFLSWVSESKGWPCCLIYSARRDHYFTPVCILTIFVYFCRFGAIDVPKRCCGVAAVSKRLLKHQKFIVIFLIILRYCWIGVAWYVFTKRGVIRSMISAI